MNKAVGSEPTPQSRRDLRIKRDRLLAWAVGFGDDLWSQGVAGDAVCMGQCASMLNQPIRFVGMNGTSNYDAVVVGSGPGGSSAAYKLSSQGLRVLVVEQGDFLKPAMVGPGDPIGVFLATTFRKGDFFGLVGGLTKFYGAALYRMRESDFRETRLESGISPAWPITYDELEPFYPTFPKWPAA